MSEGSPAAWLQSWYARQCDGYWEHTYGVKIETLDNPGWSVVIDLTKTEADGREFESIDVHCGEADWINCSVTDHKFLGYGDPTKLEAICERFREWVESSLEGTNGVHQA